MARKVTSRWCAYLLWCADGSLYAGATNDLPARVDRHQAGKGARYTRSRLPVRVARVFRAKDKSAALRREAALKRLDRAAKLALVAMKRVSDPRRRRPAPPRSAKPGPRNQGNALRARRLNT